MLPNLLVKNVVKSIKESKALKIYITNIMTEPGQTDNYSISDHLEAIFDHCGKDLVEYCLADTGEIVPEFVRKYNQEGQDIVLQDIDKATKKGIKVIQKNLSKIDGEYIRHDSDTIASSIMELICNDLKYEDKQNDPQYLMLNNKLKEDKRINKIKRQMEKDRIKSRNDDKKESNKRSSKFSSKYSERIESIKQSDEMIKLKDQKDEERR